MSQEIPQPENQQDSGNASRVLSVVHGLRDWTAGHPWRSAVIGATLMLLIIGTLVSWVQLSQIAAHEEIVTLDQALEAWDQRDLKTAKDTIRKLQSRSGFDELLGGALFVLGAIKTEEAESQSLAARRKNEYLVAARYLQEADAYGFPPGREAEGYYRLGKALVENNRFVEGIEALDASLAAGNERPTTVHRLLATAHFNKSRPELQESLEHNSAELRDEQLTDLERADANVMRTQILIGLKEYESAEQVLGSIPANSNRKAWQELLAGQILLGQASRALSNSNQLALPKPATTDLGGLEKQLQSAVQHLQNARKLDRLATEVTRRAMYLEGLALQMMGDEVGARDQFVSTRKAFAGTSEALAAALVEAEINQALERDNDALEAYRRVLGGIERLSEYRSNVLNIHELRLRLNRAVARYAEREQFDQSLNILADYEPLFQPVVVFEKRAEIYKNWGELQLRRAVGVGAEATSERKLGRERLRRAGQAFEHLASIRFASEQYPDDLWNSAESYFRGQSYSQVERILYDYLQHEPTKRNALALLRLGQSQLAQGQVEESISSLTECLDFHPLDEAVYQARNDLARANRRQGNSDVAEQLLLENLKRSRLTPRSPEWRDAQLEYGKLLFEFKKYDEAIEMLDEYIRRSELDQERSAAEPAARFLSQTEQMPARYFIAESHRLMANDTLEQADNAETSSERKSLNEIAKSRFREAEQVYTRLLNDIKVGGEKYRSDPMLAALYRNCYMLLGTVLFQQEQYDRAREAYQDLSSLYADEPFVLDTFMQIAHCWQRLNRPEKARGVIEEAQFTLNHFPSDADFLATTSFSREEWQTLIDRMLQW